MEGQGRRAGGGKGQVGPAGAFFGRADRAFGVGRRRFGLVEAVAPFAVVGDAPGRAPDPQPQAERLDLLGEVVEVEAEAVFAAGFADVGGEGERGAVGSEAELGGSAGGRGEVEDAEGSGAATAE